MTNLDAKFYGTVLKVKNDEPVHADEFVVFLAKDNAFPATLQFYRDECIRLGADPEQVQAVNRMMDRLEAWRKANPDRLKVPDAAGEKLNG